MARYKVLHITAHLGGGVGRVLSRVALHRIKTDSWYEDVFVCLEEPEKPLVIDEMRAAGIPVYTGLEPHDIEVLMTSADIVQVEWWHHPLVVELLCRKEIESRLIMWSHTSGLSYPIIPHELVYLPHSFIFTTAASPDAQRSTVVNSSGGFGDIKNVQRTSKEGDLSFGYMGSLNTSKLHPRAADYINAVNVPNFAVDFYGEVEDNTTLEPSDRVRLHGFTEEPYAKLEDMDVLIYLLNPEHYGTTENALLEAMAAGVVPIVINNKVESMIVEDGVTGFVVDTVENFAERVAFIDNDREALRRMSNVARYKTREQYSIDLTVSKLDYHYKYVIGQQKRAPNFCEVFGYDPRSWFLSCLGRYAEYFPVTASDKLREKRLSHPVLYEKAKASVFQYRKYFDSDVSIDMWAKMLEDDIESTK